MRIESEIHVEKNITIRPNKSNMLSTLVWKIYQIVECCCHWCQRILVLTNEFKQGHDVAGKNSVKDKFERHK